MHPDLAHLVQLQRAENELSTAVDALNDVPERKAEIEAALAAERAKLDAAREGLETSQKTRRQEEGLLQDAETKRSKYKGQLMDVKTNKEYTAMLHEIETVEREVREREDRILQEMERADELQAAVAAEEKFFREAEAKHAASASELEERRVHLEAERGRLTAERDEVAETLPGEVRELFVRLGRKRGVAVSEARNGSCQSCHVKLRLQLYVDVKRNDSIIQCDACSRVLFYEPQPEAQPQA